MSTTAVIWFCEDEDAWIVSVLPAKQGHELDLEYSPTAVEAQNYLKRWANQRGCVAVPSFSRWLDDGVNSYKIRHER